MFNPSIVRLSLVLIFSAFAGAMLTGCQSAYYNTMEKMGYHKRDIMVSRVEEVRESQEEAKQQFKTALDQFQSIFGKQDSDLQARYDKLNDEFESSEAAAEKVRSRIGKVESVSEALFEEWQDELDLFTNETLKRDSAKKLAATKRNYARMHRAMVAAEKKMEPVLNTFRDQVLYLKHNLNASAIDGLKVELSRVQSEVGRLINEMQRSIDESNDFIEQISKGS